MIEPQAMGQGPPTQRNCKITGRAARDRVVPGPVIRGFRPPSANANRANGGDANHGAKL